MSNFWKIFATTSVMMFLVTLGILIFNNRSFNKDVESLSSTISQQKTVMEKYKHEIDSLKNELDEYGWRTDLIFMCIGFENDTAEYPTIKIYNKEEREIGKFCYVYNGKRKRVHLGDKFFLVATPRGEDVQPGF